MNTETMTVHRALAELKVLDSRIADKIADTTLVGEIKALYICRYRLRGKPRVL